MLFLDITIKVIKGNLWTENDIRAKYLHTIFPNAASGYSVIKFVT